MTSTRNRPRRAAEVAWRSTEAGYVAVVERTGAELLMNPTARAIWEQCDGQTTPAEMVAAVCELFEVDEAVARRDVETTLDQLQAASLIEWVAPRGDA